MKNPWNTKEWKKRREEILKVRNKCEWCGLTQAESLEKYGRGLSVDHKREHVAWERPSKIYTFDRYIELRDEDIQVLCMACHMAKTKGLDLCPKCKKKYKGRRFDACKECNKEKIEERRRDPEGWARKQAEEKAESERLEELHEERFNYGLNHPELRDKKLWTCVECGEPIDFQHFCAYQRCEVCVNKLEEEMKRHGPGQQC